MTPKPSVGCLCVSTNRPSIVGIAVASFLTQQRPDGGAHYRLLIELGDGAALPSYQAELNRIQRRWGEATIMLHHTAPSVPPEAVPHRIDLGAARLFAQGCDLITIWDDDDYAPPARLIDTIEAWRASPYGPFVAGCVSGWFCNLRTLCMEYGDASDWGLWGGSLAFNKAAWIATEGFKAFPMPGYDRRFVDAARAVGAHVSVLETFNGQRPIAFSHGNNVATWLKSPGREHPELLAQVPTLVHDEIERAQAWLIKRRIHPPWS